MYKSWEQPLNLLVKMLSLSQPGPLTSWFGTCGSNNIKDIKSRSVAGCSRAQPSEMNAFSDLIDVGKVDRKY